MIVEIVFCLENLVVDVKVNFKDIGYISVGDCVDIIIISYDLNIYGIIFVEVEIILVFSFQDEYGEYYFKVVLVFLGDMIGSGNI